MKKLLDSQTIDAMTAVELPDRNLTCDCGCFLVWLDILSGNEINIDFEPTVNVAIANCNLNNGEVISIDFQSFR